MLGFVMHAGWWVVVGVVLKILVPMPWLDDPVRAAYRWVKNRVTSIGFKGPGA